MAHLTSLATPQNVKDAWDECSTTSLEGAKIMRCLACGAEMSLKQVIGDDSAPVSGFERRTFVCSVCGDSEQRLAFVKQIELGVAVPMDTAPSIAPLSSEKNEDATPPGIIKRLFANLSAVKRRLFVDQDKAAQPPAPSAAQQEDLTEAQPPLETPNPVLMCTKAPTLDAETDNEIDECEALLNRAIELVQTPLRPNPEIHPPPVTSTNVPEEEMKARPMSTRFSEAESAASVHSATSTNLPEVELEAPPLSTDIFEAEAAAPVSDTNNPEREIPAPTSSNAAVPDRPPPSAIVVEIQYDPEKAKYIAKDIKTGLSILRIDDHERLRQMCDRMGWQIVSKVPGTTGTESAVHSLFTGRVPLSSNP